jgi:hypothetical protein
MIPTEIQEESYVQNGERESSIACNIPDNNLSGDFDSNTY